jgi:hypothetical protein
MGKVTAHCRASMKSLRVAYRDGQGDGNVFESLFLTYLEVIQVADGHDPAKVWAGWMAIIKAETGGTDPLNWHLGHEEEGRKRLAGLLGAYARRFDLPRKRFSSITERVDEVNEPEPDPKENFDEFDVLFGNVFGDTT